MNIEGLDYNTQRERLILPEYGREIQRMVDYAVALPTKEERQSCAETIVAIMDRMFPQDGDAAARRQKLWDHLALMSGFKLDIDYPVDVSQAAKIAARPEPMPYPMSRIPVRHYGNMMFEIFEHLKTMEPGEERDELAKLTANQMKRNLTHWSHGSADDEKVVSDLARFTDGKIQLDLNRFKFDKINDKEPVVKNNKKKR
ncbi:DUF4290 domain-containing protein [Prevotella sp. A2931]|uniref:DUF4290 domain-containing protein n=1 Tax=Prevotella illustrans TaxID=2800387 RepID=A0ABS3M713_9BACT|nr:MULTISPECIES: DUF4290 domain-containing protein [Prevotella]MBO1363986.1 DUF4290 domain-containing protein [Prevotella illustrans]PTL27015.1 DUF4290 domain-containing protein [Prevotella sp. oral taxon 820]